MGFVRGRLERRYFIQINLPNGIGCPLESDCMFDEYIPLQWIFNFRDLNNLRNLEVFRSMDPIHPKELENHSRG